MISADDSLFQIRRVDAPQAPPPRSAQSPPDGFEALLEQVAQKMDHLKKAPDGGPTEMPPESIKKPEELEAAIQEADRKYHSTLDISKSLVEAYKATLDAVKSR